MSETSKGSFTLTVTVGSNAAPTCAQDFCGNSWVTTNYGTRAWGICCKCGASTPPADRVIHPAGTSVIAPGLSMVVG